VFPVNYLNVNRSGESIMTVSSGQIEKTGFDTGNRNFSSGRSVNNAVQSSRINTLIKSDFWSQLEATLTTFFSGIQIHVANLP